MPREGTEEQLQIDFDNIIKTMKQRKREKERQEITETSDDILKSIPKELIYDFIKDKNINTVINCAAYTAVDKAEEDAEIAEQVNSIGDALDIFNPYQAVYTTAVGNSTDLGSYARSIAIGSAHTVGGAFDGFSFFTSTGTITGTARVYGYIN